MMRKLLAAIILVLLPPALSAEIAWKHYKKAQKDAGEFLDIRVTDVSLDWCLVCSKRDVRVRAKVLKVHRTAAGIKVGNTILIKYKTWTRRPRGWAGPRPIPILKEGQTYPAFLRRLSVNKKDGIICGPAARGYSFQVLKK